jgi:tRNA A37 methylthiotransferase MiaB
MNRKYTAEQFIGVIKQIVEKFPKATIATDVIVGFPGETQEDFEESYDLIRRINPTIVNVSKYGDRPRTTASKSKEKVKTSDKKAWSRKISQLVSEIMISENESWVGWSGPVLVTKAGPKGGLICRNESYKPIVIHDSINLGEWIQVKVISAEKTHLYAELI